ncbi:MAG: cystathionine gamma-synthase [Gammaproteobacteria bacterium]|nr:cystathionine gamma-synthase [Gammaproteobacteria bacterium]
MTKLNSQQYDLATIAVQTGLNSDSNHNSVVAPIYMATNYRFDDMTQPPQYDYSRCANPTRDLLANALAELEGGAGATVTSSGMAAINLVLQLLTPQDTLVAPHDCYGGTHRLFESLAKKGAFKLVWLNFYADDVEQQLLTLKPNLIWLETPSNPLVRIADIKKICKTAKLVNALVAADNTFLSPLGQSPLALGTDIVVHSNTKYLNGHSDVVSGAVVCKSEELQEQIAWWANNTGVTGSPFDSYMILRGIRTLPLRIKQHSANAQAVAELLQAHEFVEKVNYPGLSNHPQHQLANEQHKFHGGMLSFELKGTENNVAAFVNALNLFTLAESLGGTESLVCHPGTMTHAAMPEEAQLEAGITKQLVRFSVGIEDKSDLIADVLQALAVAANLKDGESDGSTNESPSKLDDLVDETENSASCRLSPALAALW